MSALDLLQDLSWILYLIVFGAVSVRSIRRPTRAHVDIALFFGATTVVILLITLTTRLHIGETSRAISDVEAAAFLALGYLLLRLVQDFGRVGWVVMRLVEAGLVITIAAIVIAPSPMPAPLALAVVIYVAVVIVYVTIAFARYAAISRGVTRRRMQAAATGSMFLASNIVCAGLSVVLPVAGPIWAALGATLGLLSGVAYFVAFAPPTWLRRAWQEPELRRFLSVAGNLPRLPDRPTILHELQRLAADALGAPTAAIYLWQPETGKLRAYLSDPADRGLLRAPSNGTDADGTPVFDLDPHERPVSGRAFLEQRPVLVTDTARFDPTNTELFRHFDTRAALSAPITIGEHRLGVLVVYAPRAPVFANSDLELVQLLADQAGIVLESRSLIEEAAHVRAREESARLKEDFLSSAAHDLKTPLTGLLAQAQLLDRRAQRAPTEPVDRVGLARLVQQCRRLRDLVLELLDVTRLESGALLGEMHAVDLGTLVRGLSERQADWGRVRLHLPETPIVVSLDMVRFEQVITNLVDNALKYSPHDSPVDLRAERRQTEAVISVTDRGIGVPRSDHVLIFDRFHRAPNVDDRRFAGMGLGLYIARTIVQEHGGRIWVDSEPGVGSTFFVSLPLTDATSSNGSQPLPATESNRLEQDVVSA